MSDITLLADAITRQEGFYAPGQNPNYPNGTRSWINNNPGNLRDQSGRIWPDLPHDSAGFPKFPTYDDGRAALEHDLQLKADRGMTPNQIVQAWAPGSDGNDPTTYAGHVAAWTGLNMNKPLGTGTVGGGLSVPFPGGASGSSGSPGGSSSSADGQTTIHTPVDGDVPPHEVKRSLDLDEAAAEWSASQFIYPVEPYYAAAELRISDTIVAPWRPIKPVNVTTEWGDIELPGLDLRLLEFQYRYSVEGACSATFRLFVKAWTDVVATMRLCEGTSTVEFEYGYTTITNGKAGPFFGQVVSFVPRFLQNGYEVTIECIDKAMVKQSMDGAKKRTWRARSGRISDIVAELCEMNDWVPCIEKTTVNGKEQNQYVQKDQTDFAFIASWLRGNARSGEQRSWIKSDGGEGYSPYDCYLRYSPKLGKNVLHFHPSLPQEGTEPARPIRNYIWGGVMDAAKHEIGTVIDFQPQFNHMAFAQLGGANMKATSVDIWKKVVHVGQAQGTDYQDSILPGTEATMVAGMSAPRRTRAEGLSHRDSDIVKAELARRHFALRDLAFDASLTVTGDPFLQAGNMINVMVVRPNEGVMMFYDWWIKECIHTITNNGEFTTRMELKRMARQNGARASDNVPGMGVFMLEQSSSVSVQSTPMAVGKIYDPDGRS